VTEIAEFELDRWGKEKRYVTYAQSLSIIAHFSEFDFTD
jgi:hypothetical protein